MFVKYENEKIVSLFVGCVPSDVENYTEIPDDDSIINAFIAEHKTYHAPQTSDTERITALENKLVAYENAYKEGVNEA